MPIHVVVNTQAARFRRAPDLLPRMAQLCAGRATLHTTPTLDSLPAVCARAADDDAGLVVLCGGDGTAMAGVTHLVRAYAGQPLPVVALAPGGSSCTVARNWSRLWRDPVEHVGNILDAQEAGRLRHATRPTLQVAADEELPRVGFIVGTGLVSSFFEAFYEAGGGGYAQAAPMIARVLFGSFVGGALARRVLSPMPCRLTIDGQTHPHGAFTLIVSSVVRNLGMRLLVTHRGGEDPLRPHLVASNLSARACGWQYGRVLGGRPLIGPRTVDALVERFEVAFPGAGAYVLDGDLFRCNSFAVRAGPSLRVVSL